MAGQARRRTGSVVRRRHCRAPLVHRSDFSPSVTYWRRGPGRDGDGARAGATSLRSLSAVFGRRRRGSPDHCPRRRRTETADPAPTAHAGCSPLHCRIGPESEGLLSVAYLATGVTAAGRRDRCRCLDDRPAFYDFRRRIETMVSLPVSPPGRCWWGIEIPPGADSVSIGRKSTAFTVSEVPLAASA